MLSRLFSARSCIPVRRYRPMDPLDVFMLPSIQRGRVGLSFEPIPGGPVDNEFVKQNYGWAYDQKAATLFIG